MGLILGGVSASDLILDGQSVSLYVGGSPPVKVWPTGPDVVQITLGSGNQARDQFRAALTERGLDHATVTEVPFEIELVGTGSAQNMFESCWELISVPDLDTSGVTNMSNMFSYCTSITHVPDLDTSSVTNMSGMFTTCSALTHAPVMDTSNVTDMYSMFSGCGSLTHVPDMDTSKVTNTDYMFFACNSLTDGNVRLIGRHPDVSTSDMISYSGLTREPWYTADGAPYNPIEVHEVTLTNMRAESLANRRNYDLVTIEVPAGATWTVRVQGSFTGTGNNYPSSVRKPTIVIGNSESGRWSEGEPVDFTGSITSANSGIQVRAYQPSIAVNFVGTVTIEK